jgi:hypothetical protein
MALGAILLTAHGEHTLVRDGPGLWYALGRAISATLPVPEASTDIDTSLLDPSTRMPAGFGDERPGIRSITETSDGSYLARFHQEPGRLMMSAREYATLFSVLRPEG